MTNRSRASLGYAVATRWSLVRPQQGRLIIGLRVCVAFPYLVETSPVIFPVDHCDFEHYINHLALSLCFPKESLLLCNSLAIVYVGYWTQQ